VLATALSSKPEPCLSFRNDDGHGEWLHRPNTTLVDSEQLESGEGMSDEFKKIASREIEEFKAEYRARFPGRDAKSLTDEDLLREAMNTVGKPGASANMSNVS
jgi:type III restriction enzyme